MDALFNRLFPAETDSQQAECTETDSQLTNSELAITTKTNVSFSTYACPSCNRVYHSWPVPQEPVSEIKGNIINLITQNN